MLERPTEKAVKVIMLAQEEAKRLGHNHVGTEMILLGLIGVGTGFAYQALKSMGVTLKDARVETEKIIGRGSDVIGIYIPNTARAVRLLDRACVEAGERGYDYQNTEHLLLALIHLGEGVAVRVLDYLGVDLNKLHQHLIWMMMSGQTNDFQIAQTPEEEIASLTPGNPKFDKHLRQLTSEINDTGRAVETLITKEGVLQSHIAKLSDDIKRLTEQRAQFQQQLDNLPQQVRDAKTTHLAKCADLANFITLHQQANGATEQSS